MGLFDEIGSHSTLELLEVKEAEPEEAPTGAATKSCLEVRIKSDKPHDHSGEQTELLKKAQDGFTKLQHCLHKLDEEDHLEEQSAPQAVAFLTHTLKHLNKESLVKLYNSLDLSVQLYFFQILAQDPSPDSFDAVQEIYTSVWNDPNANPYQVSEAIPSFFESLDHKGKGVDVKAVKKFPAFLEKVEELDKSNYRLKNAIVLAGSGIIYESCIRKGKQDEDCSGPEELMTKISAKDPENKDENWKILKLKVIANMQLAAGLPYIKQTIDNPSTNSLFVRSEAAWSLARLARRNAVQVKEIAQKIFYDRKEDHEIRIAAYIAMVMSGPTVEVQSAVQYLVDNHDNEDRQLVSYVVSSVSNLKGMKYPDGSKCKSLGEVARVLESSVASVADRLGPHDLFDSAVYTLGSKDNRERVLVSIVAAKNDVVPRSVYIKLQDPLQQRSYSLHSVSDALLYNNLVQMKQSYEKMKKENKVPNPAIKAQLDVIFEKVKGKPSDSYFAMAFVESVDGIDVSYEKFNKPDELIQRIISLTVGNEKYTRTFRKYNELVVKSHTESGLKVKFMTTQSAVTSLEMPQLTIGQIGRTGLPVSLRYGYKLVSKTAYVAIVELPLSKFKYITGKVSDKHMALPRNVTVNFMAKKEHGDKVTHVVAKVKDDPLFGKKEMDLFYRALTPVDGNVESSEDFMKIMKTDKKALDTHTHLHDHFGFGLVVSKSPDYVRPMPWETPLTRMSFIYQEVEHETKPYKYKVALTKSDKADASSILNYEINVMKGMKNDKFLMLFGMTVTNPRDAASKSVRFTVGRAVSTKTPDKRWSLLSYENYVKKIFLRGHFDVSMPSDAAPIPAVTKGTEEWKKVYGEQKIKVAGKFKWTPTARVDFSDADVNDLLNGIGDDVDATGEGELYRTQEQIDLYASSGNSVEEAVGDNLYSTMISKAQAHPGCYLRAWSTLLKFHGVKGTIKINKPLPDQVKDVRRRIRSLMIKRYWSDMSFDIEDKAPEGTLSFWANSTVDSMRTDITLKDKTGTQKFKSIRSYLLPLLRPSASPVKIFKANTFNMPVCSIVSETGRNEIETFSRRDILTDDLATGCEYLLTSNCRGLKNFAITKKDDVYKILYDNKDEIVITKDGVSVNGEKQVESDGFAAIGESIYIGRYHGLLGVRLPNQIEVIREVGSPNAYIRASRLFRGRLCGLCGANDGNSVSDDVSSLAEFGVTGTCPA